MMYDMMRMMLTDVCHKLFKRGLVAGADGNISIRLDDGKMLITPSGICKGLLDPEQLLVQRFDGAVLEGALRSSKEAGMHIALYNNRPDVGAIIHIHSPHATAFAVCGKEIPQNLLIEMPFLLGKTPVAGYAPPGSARLVNEVIRHASSDIILLQNHGVIIQGKDLTEAFVKADALENAAKTIIYASIIGDMKKIPD